MKKILFLFFVVGYYAFGQPTVPSANTNTVNQVEFLDRVNKTHGGSIISGGIISDGGSGTVDITSGSAWLRASDSATANLIECTFSAELASH